MKKNYVHLFFFILPLFFPICLTAQSDPAPELRKREIGLRLNGLNNFGVIYKYQLSENKYRRFRFATGNITVQNTNSTSLETAFSAAIGSEKRIPISEKAKLLHGPEFSGGFNIRNSQNTTIVSLSPGASYLLGFLYQPNEKFSISLEGFLFLNTNYQFVSGTGDWLDFASISLQFSSSNIALNLTYCFESPKRVKSTSKKRSKKINQN